MCNANPLQLSILQSINAYKVEDLENFLTRHNFEISCFLKYGINAELLNAISLDLLKKHVNDEKITERELIESGMIQSKVDEIFGEKPFEVICEQCNKTFQTEEARSNYKLFCSICSYNTIPRPLRLIIINKLMITTKELMPLLLENGSIQDTLPLTV
jgi:galactitol-specific phosphotransferase system IIB component